MIPNLKRNLIKIFDCCFKNVKTFYEIVYFPSTSKFLEMLPIMPVRKKFLSNFYGMSQSGLGDDNLKFFVEQDFLEISNNY